MLTSGDIKDSFPKAKIKNGAEAMVAETETENSWMTASPHFPNQPSLSRIQISIFWENSSMPAQEENDKRNDRPTADVGEKNKMIEALSNKFLSLFVFLPERIADACKSMNINHKTAYTIDEVLQQVVDFAKGEKVLLICTGSLYLARDVDMSNKEL